MYLPKVLTASAIASKYELAEIIYPVSFESYSYYLPIEIRRVRYGTPDESTYVCNYLS